MLSYKSTWDDLPEDMNIWLERTPGGGAQKYLVINEAGSGYGFDAMGNVTHTGFAGWPLSRLLANTATRYYKPCDDPRPNRVWVEVGEVPR